MVFDDDHQRNNNDTASSSRNLIFVRLFAEELSVSIDTREMEKWGTAAIIRIVRL